ncbi:MAG: precorrin-8X methylmutase [Thermoleophilia bacterium]
MSDRAVIVLGHGSRSPEATEQFVRLVATLVPRLPHADVYPAFMELAEPAFSEAVKRAVANGANEIVVLPCFLFMGNHIKHDIPRKIADAVEAHPGVRFEQRDPIGSHPRVAEVLLERLGWETETVWGELRPEEIEAESMRVIDAALMGFGQPGERAVTKRLIHASGDLSVQSAVAFSERAVATGVAALRRGAPVITDVRMVEAGVDSRRLTALGGETRCLIDDVPVAEEAAASGRTRSATAMRRFGGELDGAVVAIGNAPSALREVVAIAAEGVARPALVVGIPVGFVDAAESKAALEASGLEFVTVRGARGGSPLAAAAVNALLRLAEEA